MNFENWPKCPMPGCPNRCCRALNSRYCWPHTGSGKSFQQMLRELNDLCELEPAPVAVAILLTGEKNG